MIRIQFRILSLLIDRMELNTKVLMTVIVTQHLTQSKQSRYDYSPECSGLARCTGNAIGLSNADKYDLFVNPFRPDPPSLVKIQ